MSCVVHRVVQCAVQCVVQRVICPAGPDVCLIVRLPLRMWPNKAAIPQFPRQIPAETETQRVNIFQKPPLQCLFFLCVFFSFFFEGENILISTDGP